MKVIEADPSYLHGNLVIAPAKWFPIVITLDDDPVDPVEGCPVFKGLPPCNHLCGGGWPATEFADYEFTWLVYTIANSARFGCGPLADRATYTIKKSGNAR